MIDIDNRKFSDLMGILSGVECDFFEKREDALLYKLWSTHILDGTQPQIGTTIISEYGNFEVIEVQKKYYTGHLMFISVILKPKKREL